MPPAVEHWRRHSRPDLDRFDVSARSRSAPHGGFFEADIMALEKSRILLFVARLLRILRRLVSFHEFFLGETPNFTATVVSLKPDRVSSHI